MDTRSFYDRISPIYDLVFGRILDSGRRRACRCLNGHRDVLEVGVGTGLTLPYYPRHCRICAVDISLRMINRARNRCNHGRVQFLVMDAAKLAFRDASFDTVFAPYVVTVVPDPEGLCRELLRVVRPGGQVVVLSHSLNGSRTGLLKQAISPLTTRIGFRTDVNVEQALCKAGVRLERIERVNLLNLHYLFVGNRPLE